MAPIDRSTRCPRWAAPKAVASAAETDSRSTTSPPVTAPSARPASPRPVTRRREFSRVATMTRATVAESSTPATSGPLGPAERVSRALAAVTSPVQTFSHGFPCRFQRLCEASGILSAGRCALGTASALSIDDGREHLFHQRVCVHLWGQVLRHVHDQRRRAVAARAEHDDPRADRLADAIGKRAQATHIAVTDVGSDQLRAADGHGLREQRRRDAVDPATLHRRKLLLEPLARLAELHDGLRQTSGWNTKRGGRAREAVAHLANLAQRANAGHGPDPPHARADALLLRDEERADISGAVTVRASTELATRAGFDHANLVVVLLAEERHGARGKGFAERHDASVNARVVEDRAVHLVLDTLELLRRKRAAEREVKTKIRRVHERAGLMHVLTKEVSEGRVQKMRPRVVAHRVTAKLLVDSGARSRGHAQHAIDHLRAHHDDARRRALSVRDHRSPLIGRDRAAIAHLTAALWIERCAVEDDLDISALVRESHP